MSRFVATKAERQKIKARIGLTGATNTGKTYTALMIACGILKSEGAVLEDGTPDWSKVAVIDTERNRALFYANNGIFGSFQHIDFTPPYSPSDYIDAVQYAESLGCIVCIIDSLSHAWNGTGGILDIVSNKTANSRSKNTFNEGWGGKDGGTAMQNHMVDVILSSKMHTICTFRQKMEYVQERDEATGKTIITKLGVKPVQRDDLEYEFDITLKLNNDHTATIIKNTVQFLGNNSDTLPIITPDFGELLCNYLNKGVDPSVCEQQIKDGYIVSLKALCDQYPELKSFIQSKYNKKINTFTNEELKNLLIELKEMVKCSQN